jgi:hypothetical protein
MHKWSHWIESWDSPNILPLEILNMLQIISNSNSVSIALFNSFSSSWEELQFFHIISKIYTFITSVIVDVEQ